MLWIVGKIFSDFEKYLQAHEITYGLFADQQNISKKRAEVPTVNVDYSSHGALIKSLANNPQELNVTAVMVSGYEQYVVAASWLGDYFNVPSTSFESAKAATDKFIMRQHFKNKFPDITPDFNIVNSWEDARKFTSTHDFPLILKPTNLMKSLFVTQSDTLAELKSNYQKTLEGLPSLQTRLQMPQEVSQIIIEEFLEGTMHTVAGFVNAKGRLRLIDDVSDCLTAKDVGIRDNYIYSRQLPSKLSPEDASSVLDVAAQGVSALGLTNVPLHIEIMLTPKGPKIIEIGARLGGYRPKMYQYALGIDLFGAALATAANATFSLAATHRKYCAVIELFPEQLGAFTSLSNMDRLKNLDSFLRLTIRKEIGTVTGPARQGYRAAAVVTLGNEDQKKFEEDLDYTRRNVAVQIV